MKETLVLKYPLNSENLQSNGTYKLSMPKGSKIQAAHLQNGVVKIWATCKPRHRHNRIDRYFVLVATGEEKTAPKNNLVYCATSFENGNVQHVFESI